MTRRFVVLALALLIALTPDVAAALASGAASAAASSAATQVGLAGVLTATSTSPCGRTSHQAAVHHVIWIFMENHGYNQVIGAKAAPYENLLASQCGLATNYHGITHPSLPNYIAATSGSTRGVTDDAGPDVHALASPSIYSQVKAAGLTWRDYEESAPGRCPMASTGRYAVRHDPAPYYTSIRADCATWNIPMGTPASGLFRNDLKNSALPAFAFITPNLCNDTHDCPVATGDAWLKSWIPKIVTSPGYQDGSTVIVITWDEDERTEGNRIPTLVIAPSVPAGRRSATRFSHYSLLRTTEELLGITTFLSHAADPATRSMRADFNL